ncbi:chalcone isomerase family protein [Undibacterium fentianense]|uniref:Chalcone isomerase family protein n=1 Tax=Undibacterium fentianense TaxID=2828728 RepID=A0A941ID63_9BURK|nr:chalcone isomerase family protein [Undibacterium fentianense]MBR7799623.1 chalcone isomerase family protein [Undibacterium fentianense]
MKFLLNIIRCCAAAFAVLSVTSFGANADNVTVSGVKLDETVQVGTQSLKLNGAGVRYKVFFKVYVAALYLPELKSTPADVLALPGAKRVTLVMMRDLSNDDLGQRFMDGLRNNLELDERAKLIKPMITFGQMFSLVPVLKKGDVLTFDWIPGTGIVCQFNGTKIGETINDATFYNAVLRIWIGKQPADEALKQKMLNSKEK